jgi:HlyD family secretion protein
MMHRHESGMPRPAPVVASRRDRTRHTGGRTEQRNDAFIGSGRHRWSRVATLLAVTAAVAAGGCRDQQPTAAALQPESATRRVQTQKGAIGCIGRIEAGDGIVRVAARGLGGQPTIVGRMLVKQGDQVTAGQVLAELDTKEQLEAAVSQAASRVETARRRLAQVQVGAKPSDVAAQQAEVERMQSDLENAQAELQRHAALGRNTTASELDRLKLRVDSVTRALTAARQRLASLSEVRPVDVELARAELQEAMRNESRTRAELKTSTITSPITGRVVKVNAWPGEAVGADGLLELAPIEPMYAIAEVAETDIPRVKVGQRAEISGDGLKNPIQGTVDRVGVKVLQNQLMKVDPANFSDARVVEVWIKVDDGRRVADLIHMRVEVVIQP